MRTRIYTACALFAGWLMLTQSTAPLHLTVGVVAAFVIARLNTAPNQHKTAKISWINAILYVPWLIWKVLQSGTHIAYLILHPRMPIEPKLIRYETKLASPLGVVLLGNSITLTPGTITAEITSNELVIHAMDQSAAGDITGLILERKIATVVRSAQ
jgi:multicomponent Na+:H+ antiporter subunit E